MGLAGLLKTIIIIVVIWQAFKMIGRYVLPWLLKKGMAKVQNNMESKFQDAANRSRASQKPEGGISLDNANKTSRRTTNDSVGEYVEFEEVD